MNLELLSNGMKFDFDECNPECLPFEESLNEDLKNADGKLMVELDKELEEYCEESKAEAEEYLRNAVNDYDDYDDDDGYSSEEDIPTCNPWRE